MKQSPHLGQDVVHRLARLDVALSKHAEQPEDLDLQERVGDAGDVVFGRVTGRDERFEVSYEQRDGLCGMPSSAPRMGGLIKRGSMQHLAKLVGRLLVHGAHFRHQRHAAEEHAVVAVGQQRRRAGEEVVEQFGHFFQYPHRAQSRLCEDL